MFELFKPKLASTGPYVFQAETDIAASAEDVFALVDFADPRNAERVRGATIETVAGTGDCFIMRMPAMPDFRFHIEVLEAEAPNHYAFAIVCDPPVGRMARSTEAYTIWNVPGGGCRLRLENTVTFQDGLRLKHVQEEIGCMTIASHNSVAKLKLQAEQGVSAVHAVEDRIIV